MMTNTMKIEVFINTVTMLGKVFLCTCYDCGKQLLKNLGRHKYSIHETRTMIFDIFMFTWHKSVKPVARNLFRVSMSTAFIKTCMEKVETSLFFGGFSKR